MSIFDIALESLDDSPFEEDPVDLKTFLYSPDFCNLQKLSEPQELLVELMSQVYRKEDLIRLYGRDRGEEVWSHTKKEIIMQLGKGSGKDFTSTVGCAYLVYKLLCLKDPARYFNKPSNDSFDIINIAVNAQQANNVFFKNFVERIEGNKWFVGKFSRKMGQIVFDKNITVHSGHSEREAWEGYNTILVILDEIAGFAMSNDSNNEFAKTADAVYRMYKGSIVSRFPDIGKLVLLSFPRFKGDFITQRYDKVVVEKETVIREHTFKLNLDLPDGIPENEFTIEWEEDHIISYEVPSVYALKRPSWEIHPFRRIDEYMEYFIEDPVDALSRFACMPPEAVDAFFRSPEKVREAFSRPMETLDELNRPVPGLADPEKAYYVHVDLAQKHDRCAVAVSSVGGWSRTADGKRVEPIIDVDIIRFWTTRSDKPLDFDDVVEFIVSVRDAGYNIKLVTFDRWNSVQTIQDLRQRGIKAEVLSVMMPQYTDFMIAVNEGRVRGPLINELIDEMLALRIMKNAKVDHPRKGYKDISDAVCGSIYNTAKYTQRYHDDVIEVYTPKKPSTDKKFADDVIVPPRRSSIEDGSGIKLSVI